MAHTPGPWAVREPDEVERELDISEGVPPEEQELTEVYAEDGGQQVCYVMNDTECEAANARLIAAAPDLYAVCQKLLAWQSEDDPYKCDDWMEFATALGAEAGRAVAKAEGDSND